MAEFTEITVVSNIPDEFAEKEDRHLAKDLQAFLPTSLELLANLSADKIKNSSAYIFRCIYDDSIGNVVKDMAPIYARLHEEKIPYLTVHNGKGDQRGKTYLAELYHKGFPVVPTFANKDRALHLQAQEYLIKPLVGGTGKGVRRVTIAGLQSIDVTNGYVIQPVLDLAFETSHLYIDNEFQFALKTQDSRWDLVVYQPNPEELLFSQQFVNWNPIKGIQRIDCLWTTGGKQYLLELEDYCPFLSLYDSEYAPKETFIKNLFASLRNFDYDALKL